MDENSFKILIVDDEPVNIWLLEKALMGNYEICTAGNGIDAIRQINTKAPDMVLLDIMLPDMSGFDVCRIIKADEQLSAIQIIFLTAMDSITAELEGLQIGGIDYITKPINIELVKLRVSNHLDLKRQHKIISGQRDLLARQKEELEASLARIKRLEGIIPICSYCKKIRDDNSTWNQLEHYISDHSEAVFSHGMCPECAKVQMRILENMK